MYFNEAQPPQLALSYALFHIMPSDLQSSLQLLRLYDYICSTVLITLLHGY